ncbi:MAG: polysaccharide deacetylase family protein [Alphaproteobacteria bacterium]|nr:polysaccharide deacetylase family protein [Alphaproteobacteria bacterium]MBV8411715.1 polysaccharide deacetylase family protein [Alphaproteobacteria bacterium]
MTSWQALAQEAARWCDCGRTADLWWRDDDAADRTAALDDLLALQHETSVPVALAVVPARATPGLAQCLSALPQVDVLQHGYAHVNHAPPAEKKVELGPYRPAMAVLGELGAGWLALERLLGQRALPVLVPPWNRIAPALVPTLPEIGFRGLSAFGARRRTRLRGLIEVNTHVDLIDWKGSRGFVGAEAALGNLVDALAAARLASMEPVGLLSHHLAMDATAWDFLRSMWEKVWTLPGLRLRSARELFADAGSATGEEGG